MQYDNIEIMAPAGAWDSLHAAIKAKANSVYFGIDQLNMRAKATNNFTKEDLPAIVELCEQHNIKTYVTLNTVMYDTDISLIHEVCDAIKKSQATAVIASDMAVINYASSIGLPVHISTQLNVSNIEALRFYSQFADVVVLARELSLEQIKNITRSIEEEDIRGPSGEKVKIEIFVHGALCVAISGKCYMSLAHHNTSANRGACLQVCRRRYRVIDEDTNKELLIDNKYIMSPKDLCTIDVLDEILSSGVAVLKIEGRGRPPEYVYTVVTAYREALEAIKAGEYTQDKVTAWTQKLSTVYNRGFWHGGYYLGKDLGEWSGIHGSRATKKKIYIGKVTNYYTNLGVAEFKIEADTIKDGDEFLITGNTTGPITGKAESIRTNDNHGYSQQGDVMTMPVTEKVRRNDKLFIIVDR